jgi:hypothetical protein
MGNGLLNEGIENAVKCAEAKSAESKDILLRIANKIISEYAIKQEQSCEFQ